MCALFALLALNSEFFPFRLFAFALVLECISFISFFFVVVVVGRHHREINLMYSCIHCVNRYQMHFFWTHSCRCKFFQSPDFYFFESFHFDSSKYVNFCFFFFFFICKPNESRPMESRKERKNACLRTICPLRQLVLTVHSIWTMPWKGRQKIWSKFQDERAPMVEWSKI